MDKTILKQILRQQAATFANDVRRKLEILQSDDVVFTGVDAYTAADAAGYQDAFRGSAEESPVAPSRLANKAEQTPVAKGGLSGKISALRGCSLPGDYLFE